MMMPYNLMNRSRLEEMTDSDSDSPVTPEDGSSQSDDADLGVAVAEPEAEDEAKSKSARGKPKRQPPYAVVVLNDDDHTFAYVIELFAKVLRYDVARCVELAQRIHLDGRAVVWSGEKETAELKRDLIRGGGPDFHAPKIVRYPMGVIVEQMPGE